MKVSTIKAGMQMAMHGAWVKNVPLDAGLTINLKVRSLRNPDASRIRSEMVSALPEGTPEPIPDAVTQSILDAQLACAVILDWDLTDDDGKRLACTPEAVHEMLADPDIGKAMRSAGLYAGSVVAQQGVASLEADVKN